MLDTAPETTDPARPRDHTPGEHRARRRVVGGEVASGARSGPRERLLEHGGAILSEAELLAVLLGTGRRGTSAVSLAEEILDAVGGLTGLRTADPDVIRRKGMGPAKSARVLAAVELATRIAFADVPRRLSLDRPEAAARYLLLRWGRRDQEVMGAVFLDVRNQPLHERELYRGTLRRASVEPRGILRPALTLGAAGVLLFHTHPSGDPSPSVEDLSFTERLQRAMEVVGVRLVDHLILGTPSRWTSLRRLGALG